MPGPYGATVSKRKAESRQKTEERKAKIPRHAARDAQLESTKVLLLLQLLLSLLLQERN